MTLIKCHAANLHSDSIESLALLQEGMHLLATFCFECIKLHRQRIVSLSLHRQKPIFPGHSSLVYFLWCRGYLTYSIVWWCLANTMLKNDPRKPGKAAAPLSR